MYSDHFTLLVVSNVCAKLWNPATISLAYRHVNFEALLL